MDSPGEKRKSFCRNYKQSSKALKLREKEKKVFRLYVVLEEDKITYE